MDKLQINNVQHVGQERHEEGFWIIVSFKQYLQAPAKMRVSDFMDFV